MFLCEHKFPFFWDQCPRAQLLDGGKHSEHMLSFVRNFPFFQWLWHSALPLQHRCGPASLHPHQGLESFAFWLYLIHSGRCVLIPHCEVIWIYLTLWTNISIYIVQLVVANFSFIYILQILLTPSSQSATVWWSVKCRCSHSWSMTVPWSGLMSLVSQYWFLGVNITLVCSIICCRKFANSLCSSAS